MSSAVFLSYFVCRKDALEFIQLVGPSGPTYVVNGLSINYARRLVAVAGEPVELTGTEYAVLYELAVLAPRVMNQSLLLQRVWGPERVGEGWLVRDVVKRLRRKLGDDAADPRYIVTEPRKGYRMAAGEEEVLVAGSVTGLNDGTSDAI